MSFKNVHTSDYIYINCAILDQSTISSHYFESKVGRGRLLEYSISLDHTPPVQCEVMCEVYYIYDTWFCTATN